jgi:hypothetical protein
MGEAAAAGSLLGVGVSESHFNCTFPAHNRGGVNTSLFQRKKQVMVAILVFGGTGV